MLLDKYSDTLMSIGMRYSNNRSIVLDAIQETWIIVFNQMDKYVEKGFFIAWAKKILIRELLRIKNKENSKIVYLNDIQNKNMAQKPAAEKKLELQEVMTLVAKIPSPAKDIFIMNVMDGLKHKEIAEIMNIKESTSRVHVTNARKFLKESLAKISNRKVKV